MQRVQNIQLDGAALLDGIGGNSPKDGFDFGTVSTGTYEKIYESEKLSKGEQTTEVTYQKPQQENHAGTMEDVMQQAENIDAGLMKNKMVVASNTTTTTDCKHVEQDGFSLQQTEIETIVTVTDKIKIELAKAGVDISYFGDSLSAEQLEKFGQNAALARQLASKIQQMQADIPLTVENVGDCQKALQEAGELHKLNDGALKYMLDNQLEPSIANLYKAQYSGSALYADPSTQQLDLSGMQGQISKVIAQAGLPEDAQTLSDSQWMLRNQILLTADNLDYLEQLKALEFPQDPDKMLSSMVTAISEGKRPQDAMLLDGYSLMGQAQKAVDVLHWVTDVDLAYVVSQGEAVTIKNLERVHNQIKAGMISREEAQAAVHLVQGAEKAEQAADGGLSQGRLTASAGAIENGTSVNTGNMAGNGAAVVGITGQDTSGQPVNKGDMAELGAASQSADAGSMAGLDAASQFANAGSITGLGAASQSADAGSQAGIGNMPGFGTDSSQPDGAVGMAAAGAGNVAQADGMWQSQAAAGTSSFNMGLAGNQPAVHADAMTSAVTENTAAQAISGAVAQASGMNGKPQADSIMETPQASMDTDTYIQPAGEKEETADSGMMGNGTGNPSQNQDMEYDEQTIALVSERRLLEQIRLRMTVESSYFMLKQGISVDTTSMEQLIQELKQIEHNYYEKLLEQGGVEATEANVSLFAETTEKVEELKDMPAYALGARNIEVVTLEELHQDGSQMQQEFDQANQRYETMQTKVRKDLGDSIHKAFYTVDDILRELGQDINLANERAVRILGYNQIEITPENIAKMKKADQQVQTAFQNMTPSVIREFIGRGINPLDLDITELNRQAEQIKTELNINAPEEKYSEYLYKLEQNHSITPEERSAFIGIYRLMNHVAQSDGAAIGALVNQGADLTMRNLLTAVRSEMHGNMDITIDDLFGELKSGGYRNSITSQIEAGYQQQCVKQAMNEISPQRLHTVTKESGWEQLTPEQFLQKLQEAPEDVSAEESYYKQQLEDLEKCANTSHEVYQVLEQYELPNTVMNVMAVAELMKNRNGAYRSFFGRNPGRTPDSAKSTDQYMKTKEDGSVEVDFEAIQAELLQRFGEEIKKPKELAKAMAELAECAEKCMSTMILEPDVTSLDIRSLKLMNAQISVNAKMASSECFSMPIVVDGEVTNVTLKIVRDKGKQGLVNITLETSRLGKIAAEFKARQNGITGYVAANSRQTRDFLKSVDGKFTQALQGVQDGPLQISYVTSTNLNLNHFAAQSGTSVQPETEEEQEVQTKVLYGMAEGFIRVLRQLEVQM